MSLLLLWSDEEVSVATETGNRTLTPSIELGLGGSFYSLVLQETHYKFWDMVPVNDDLSIRQRMSTGTSPAGWSSGDSLTVHGSPSLRVASSLPEGGVAVMLDGSSQYLSSVYDETLSDGTVLPESLEAVVVLHALPASGQEPAIIGGGDLFAVTMQSDGRVYGWYGGSRVVDLPVSLNVPLHIALTRSGSDPDTVTLYVNGVSDSAAVSLVAVNRGHLHIGKHWSNSHYQNMTVSVAAAYPALLSADDVAAHYAAVSWTDISDDVMVEPPLTIERGIRDDHPLNRVAATGTCTFALDNSTLNSADTLGYYSPSHADVRPGFTRGIPVRVLVDDETTEWEIFRGRVQVIAPMPGVDGTRSTFIMATDLIDDAARFRLNQLPIQEDVRGDDVFKLLVSTLPNQPNGITFDTGSEVYDVALDNTQDESVAMSQEFSRLALSEYGRIYVQRAGGFVYENRSNRAGRSVSLSLEDTQLSGLNVVERTRDSINRAEATVHPRVVDDDPTTVLFALQSSLEIPAGETRVILGPYRVESAPDTIVRVGGLSLEEPLAVTDYLMNSAEDGSGADATSDLSVVANYGANGVQYRLTNAGASTGYVTKLQARGRGVYDFRTVVVEATDDASIAANGVNSMALDMPYQENAEVARQVASGILDAYGELSTRARQVTLYPNDRDLGGVLGYDISTRVHIEEELSNLDADGFINGVRFEFLGGVLGKLTWWLAPPEDTFS